MFWLEFATPGKIGFTYPGVVEVIIGGLEVACAFERALYPTAQGKFGQSAFEHTRSNTSTAIAVTL